MTNDRTENRHPTDLELAAWVDEPGIDSKDLHAHVEGCERCRARLAELAETRAALALDPPMPSATEFAAQRERIQAAIEGAPRAGEGHVARRIGWLVPIAAAAAVAAIVVVNSPDPPTPVVGPVPETVAAEAEAAAEEAAAMGIEGGALDAVLAAAEALTPPASIERSIESEFALLTEDEQSAVLLELARTDFDL